MKKLNLLLIVFTVLFSAKIFAQDMTLPPPIKSPIFESLTGTWQSESYEMMGSTMSDEVTQKMVFNSQFLKIEIKSVSATGFIYEGLVMIAPTLDGTVSGYGFDIFGGEAITTYSGTWRDNMIYLYGTGSWGTESRVINVDGNVMTQNVILKMKDANGKQMPEQNLSISYNKKM